MPADSRARAIASATVLLLIAACGENPTRVSPESLDPPAVMLEDLSSPGGERFHGARVEFETCAFDYVFDAAAEDALGRLDGTPLRVPFVTGSPPAIDSLLVPPVILLAPTCPPDRPQFCVDVDPASFGPDTLVVLGVHVPDNPSDGLQTPLGLGWNAFTLPLRAWAHDHPRDRNVPGKAALLHGRDPGARPGLEVQLRLHGTGVLGPRSTRRGLLDRRPAPPR